MKTQADKLDLLVEQKLDKKKNVKFIAITSGKGGVGKSTISANLGYTLWKLGFRVGLFDADIGLANLDVIMGVKAQTNILHVLKGHATFEDALVQVEQGLYLIPGESGEEILKYSGEYMLDKFIDASMIFDSFDFVIIDTGAGIGEHIQQFLKASDEVIVITAPDPAAITDAYATIKIISKERKGINVVMNMVRNEKEARLIFEKLKKVANSNIGPDLDLELIGKLNHDAIISKSIKQRAIFSKVNPGSEPAEDIENIARNIANKMEQKVLKETEKGRFGIFFKKILGQF